jgi:flagellar motor switch protein FliG
MDYMGQVKIKDVSSAQRQVIDVVRELDEKGIVNLSGGGGDDVYVS